MQLTNSVVTICCNNVLSVTGGDMYISVMTIISSVRQMVETPIYAITEGSSPIISYNYGARRPRKVLRAAVSMALMALVYTLTIWAVILLAPHFLISIFSSDPTLQADTIPAMKLDLSTFGFYAAAICGPDSVQIAEQAPPRGVFCRRARSSLWCRSPTRCLMLSAWAPTACLLRSRFPT